MNGSAASAAYLILAVFLGGVAIGVLAMVAMTVPKQERREDRHLSLSGSHVVPRSWRR
jgi:hypothetical protein